MNHITVHKAVAASRTGKALGDNCQDAVTTLIDEAGIVGILCDGCGSQPHSEVGSYLSSQFVAELCMNLIRQKQFSLDRVYGGLVDFYRTIAHSVYPHTRTRRGQFVINSLLTTVYGFVYTPQTTTVFCSGDGVIQIDEEIEVINQNNQPDYIAYHLLGGRPQFFNARTVSLIGKIAVCSDAWSAQTHLLQNVWKITHPDGLQRLVNIYSKNRMFADDSSIITLEVKR